MLAVVIEERCFGEVGGAAVEVIGIEGCLGSVEWGGDDGSEEGQEGQGVCTFKELAAVCLAGGDLEGDDMALQMHPVSIATSPGGGRFWA